MNMKISVITSRGYLRIMIDSNRCMRLVRGISIPSKGIARINFPLSTKGVIEIKGLI